MHAPIDTGEVALAVEGSWDETPLDEDTSVLVQTPGERSWPGVRAFAEEELAFEPRVEQLDADQWADEVPPEPDLDTSQSVDLAIEAAESMVARGDLGAALGLYQELAVRSPDDPRLWERVEQIARLLQRRSSPPDAS